LTTSASTPGGPGTGKTTVILAFLRAYVASGQVGSIYVLCPTNAAIENIKIRLEAEFEPDVLKRLRVITIHALAYRSETIRRDDGTLGHPANALMIFEESSMYDNILGAIIAENRRNAYQCRYLFVGDPEQLPPVSRHSVFREMLARFKHLIVRLNINYRSKDAIIKNANAILAAKIAPAGLLPAKDDDCSPEPDSTLLLMELTPTSAGIRFTMSGHDLARAKTNTYQVHDYEDSHDIDWHEPIREVIALTAEQDTGQIMYITHRNVDVLAINTQIRDAMTKGHCPTDTAPPQDFDDPAMYRIYPVFRDHRLIGRWEWHVGDRCRSLLNDRDKRIANGSIGHIDGFGEDGYLIVRYRDHLIPIHHAKLWPAYCITVHNSQGQEWDNVVFCELGGDPIPKELAYVALSRARKRQYIIRLMAGPSSDLLPTQFLLTNHTH